jgi:hypothetical protein
MSNKYERIGTSILFNLSHNVHKENQPLNNTINELFALLSMDNQLKYSFYNNELFLLSDNSVLSVIVNGLQKDVYSFNGMPFYLLDIEINPISIQFRKNVGIFLILTEDDKNLMKEQKTTQENISVLTELKNVLPVDLYNKTYTITKLGNSTENNYGIILNKNDKNKIFNRVLKNYDTSVIYFKGHQINYIIKKDKSQIVKKINPVLFLVKKLENEFIMVLNNKNLNENLDENLIEILDTNSEGNHSISFDIKYPPPPKKIDNLIILLTTLCIIMLMIIAFLIIYYIK